MSSDALLEELEVLESIYPTELSKLSERDIEIDVEPDDPGDDAELIKLKLAVRCPAGYPDSSPQLSLKCVEGDLDDDEIHSLLEDLQQTAEMNLGMAMIFSLISHLKDHLASFVLARAENRRREEMEMERIALMEEEARTRGTPVTVESFSIWKVKFERERANMKAREEEERLKGLTPKEREEWKRVCARLSGRQLFEGNKNLEEDALMEEGTVSVDISQYERTGATGDDDEEIRITFSDSE